MKTGPRRWVGPRPPPEGDARRGRPSGVRMVSQKLRQWGQPLRRSLEAMRSAPGAAPKILRDNRSIRQMETDPDKGIGPWRTVRSSSCPAKGRTAKATTRWSICRSGRQTIADRAMIPMQSATISSSTVFAPSSRGNQTARYWIKFVHAA